MLQQQSADHRADRHAEPDRTGPGTDRPGPLTRVEDVGDDRQGGRQDRRSPDTHHRPGPDQLGRRLGVRRPGRGQPEKQEAGEQDLLAPEPVTEDAPGEQQAGEDQCVRVDGPLQVALARAQAVPGIGDDPQRHVQYGRVEDDDQQADDQYAEDQPAARVP